MIKVGYRAIPPLSEGESRKFSMNDNQEADKRPNWVYRYNQSPNGDCDNESNRKSPDIRSSQGKSPPIRKSVVERVEVGNGSKSSVVKFGRLNFSQSLSLSVSQNSFSSCISCMVHTIPLV